MPQNSDWTKNADPDTVGHPARLRAGCSLAMADTARPNLRPAYLGVVLVLAAAGILWWATGGGLGHRSVAEFTERIAIPADIDTVRIELQSGTVGIDGPLDAAAAPAVDCAGGVRRAANDESELKKIEAVTVGMTVVNDAARPRTLVLRGPAAPADATGLLAVELGLRIPLGLAVEVAIAGSGHVTIANRTGRMEVTTRRGDLRFERCRGAVRGKTGHGNVIAFDHEGDLDLFTGVGDMQAFVSKPAANLRLVTGKGTVQCGVPEDCEFDLDGRAEVGKIGADFGLAAERVGEYGAAVVGKRGAAATKVVLRTESGHLAFRAKKFG